MEEENEGAYEGGVDKKKEWPFVDTQSEVAPEVWDGHDGGIMVGVWGACLNTFR